MGLSAFNPILIVGGYFVLIIAFVGFVVYAVLKYLSLKKEQNDLLREIIRKMDVKSQG